MSRELRPCGTESAYQRHLRAGEPTCQPCRDAHAEHGRAKRAKSYVRGPYGRDEPKCGTRRGYRRHLRRGEVTCADCCRAEREYRNEYVARRRAEAA